MHQVSTGGGAYKQKLLDAIRLKTNTNKGFDEAVEGDGVRLGFPESTTGRGRVQKQKSGALQTGESWGVVQGKRIRKLTPTECLRLQGFPDDWLDGLSDGQKYRCLGNAVSVPIVKMIIEKLYKSPNAD